MKHKVIIKQAHQVDLAWINQKYDEVNFLHSTLYNEIVAIAHIGATQGGIGRLIKIESNIFELGGMYVLEAYRKHKIATQIINFLLQQVGKNAIIYCIPFKELTDFYKRFGFEEIIDVRNIPYQITEKYRWCSQEYKQEVELLCKK